MDSFLFICGSFLALGGAVVAVAAKHLFRAALGLSVALAGTAGLFIPLGGEFVSVVQVLVYLGAVAIAIVFILMLSPPFYLQRPRRNPWKIAAAAGISILFSTPLLITALSWPAAPRTAEIAGDATKKIGMALLQDYAFPFEIISVVLTIAIIGAIVIARDLPSDKLIADDFDQREARLAETSAKVKP